MEKEDHIGQLKQQIKLLEEALGQSDRIRGQWHHANRQLTASRQALKKSEALHRGILINAFDAIIIADPTGVILEANPAAAEIFGYPQEDWNGLKITTLIPEYLRRKHEHGFHHFIETGERNIIGQCVEIEALHRDGHVFPIELAISALEHDQYKVMATIRDITTRKQADALVRKLSSAIEQTGESILITDSNGIIEYVNPAFTRITGYSSEEAMGQTPRLLKSGNQGATFYEAMWKTIRDGKVWHGKVIDKRKDGSFYPAMLTISPIFNESGDAVYLVGTQSDLSNLENMEQQFYQAQKMEAVGTMVGGIAHNFNNMLAGMAGNLYLAKKKVQAQPDVVEKLDNVEELSRHAAEMIAQLLAFARKGVVSMKAMPLTPFINETLKLMRTSVPENIAVHQNMCADDLQITGDPTQLHQVLANLVNNACDAVEGVHEPCITIRLESFHTDEAFIESRPYFKRGAYADLSVADNGMGIPEAQIAHLFEPFFTTKDQSKGTGLGLAMVYGAIKSHHGFIEVESTPGQGATFHLYVPLLELKEIAAKPVQKQEAAVGQENQGNEARCAGNLSDWL